MYDKYIGKGWEYSGKKKTRRGEEYFTEIYFIIDVKIVTDKRSVKDENGRTVFERIPHKRGGGSNTVMKMEEVQVPAILAIKVKHTRSASRYSITNPTAQYAVSNTF